MIDDLKWWEKIYYPVYRFWKYKVACFPFDVKCFIQRGRRGWSEKDVWSVDDYLTRIIPEMLRELAKNPMGCPEGFIDTEEPYSCDKWSAKLREIADGLEQWEVITSYRFPFNAEWKALEDKRNLRWNFEPAKNGCSEMKFSDDFTKEEQDRYWVLSKHLEEVAMSEWHSAMADFQKYFGNLWD